MSGTTIRRWMAVLVAGLACGVAGWWAGRASAAAPLVAKASLQPAASAAAPHTLFAPGPVIALDRDGRVTLHVDGEPLKWVLAEIDRQAGGDVAAAAASATTRRDDAPREPQAVAAATANPDEIAARVLRGSEPQRYETLMRERSGGAVSEDMLETLYRTDASPRVRLLAFDYAQEATEGDPAARRAELEAARLLPDAVIAQEAGRRLDALERQASHAPPQGSSPH